MSNAIPSGFTGAAGLARVPEGLRRHDRWVCWRRETRVGKPTKVPYNPATGLRARGAQSVFHYIPLHLSPMGRRFGGRPGGCPVTEWASDRLVRLPFYNDLTSDDQAWVIDSIREFRVPTAAGTVESKALPGR